MGSVDAQSAESLVVRTAWRRCNVPVAAVDAVVPAARLIVVVDDRSGEAAQAPLQHVAATVADKAPPLARFVRDVAVTAALVVAAALVMFARAARVAVLHAAQLVAIAFARLTAPPRRPR